MISSTKPPLGVLPREIWSEQQGKYAGGDPNVVAARARDLVAAIGRFVEAGERPLPEWQDELQERIAWLYKQADSPEAAARRVQRQLTQMNAAQNPRAQPVSVHVTGGGGGGSRATAAGHGVVVVTSFPGGTGGSGGSK
jgi:hypothetical protein